MLQAFDGMAPRARPRFARWCVENIRTDEHKTYDFAGYPHNTGPGGPADAVDDHRVRTITQQFGTRLGKSFTGLSMLLYYADVDPCPMMLATESERSLKKKIMRRLYQMIYGMPRHAGSLLYKSKRDHGSDMIEFRDCRIIGAWARSPGTLADENIKVGMANELDKEGWDGSTTSVEGAPHKLFDERFKDFQAVRKVLYEGTPTIYGRSRVERRRLISTNCDYFVPCPHCGKYQVLRLAAEDETGQFDFTQPGRLEWKRRPDGKNDKLLALKSAYYVCISGACPPIENHSRAWMMRRGVWAPEGCGVDNERARAAAERWYQSLAAESDDGAELWSGWPHADWITGQPVRDGPDTGYFLSSLYALALGWGDIAADYVESEDSPAEIKSFTQNWLAKTWRPVTHQVDWQTIGQRLINKDLPRSVAPDYASLLTVGIDRQKDHYVYAVDAWGPQRTHATVEYGEFEELEWLIPNLLEKPFPFADGNGELRVEIALIDDGYKPDSDVMDFCLQFLQKGIRVLPCKGSPRSLDADYKIAQLGSNTSKPGMLLVHVDTVRTQLWMDKTLYKVEKGDPGSMQLHAGSLLEHQDFLEQIINDGPIPYLDPRTNTMREQWKRLDLGIPNDLRDCRRYSYAGMLIHTRGAAIRPRTEKKTESQPAINNSGVSMPDGRPYL